MGELNHGGFGRGRKFTDRPMPRTSAPVKVSHLKNMDMCTAPVPTKLHRTESEIQRIEHWKSASGLSERLVLAAHAEFMEFAKPHQKVKGGKIEHVVDQWAFETILCRFGISSSDLRNQIFDIVARDSSNFTGLIAFEDSLNIEAGLRGVHIPLKDKLLQVHYHHARLMLRLCDTDHDHNVHHFELLRLVAKGNTPDVMHLLMCYLLARVPGIVYSSLPH